MKTAYTRDEVIAILERTVVVREREHDLMHITMLHGRIDDTEFGQDIPESVQTMRHDEFAYNGRLGAHKRRKARLKIAEQMLKYADENGVAS